MGDQDVDQAILDKTKKELGAVIKQPKLKDNLLKKPPFRFLHDIVHNVIKTTGFATMLYTDDELDSAKVTEKESKIFFLQKIISSVNYTLKLDPPLAAKPQKIVSGLEPEHTNTMLQELVRATKVPREKSDKAVAKVVAKLQQKQQQAAAAADKKKEEKAPEPAKGEPEAKPADPPAKEEKPEEPPPAPASAAPPAAPAAAPASAAAPRPATAQQPEGEPKEKVPVEPRQVARKQQKEEQAVEAVGVIKEGKKGKGSGLEKNTLDTDSEDENPHADDTPFAKAMAAEGGGGGDGVQGHLMQEIEKKKEAMRKQQEEQEKEQKEDTSIQLKTTMRKPTKDREVFSTEVSKLRDSLQALVKTTNPLGKTFDYMQEDIDSMAKEYASWKRQAADTKAQAQETERTSQDKLQPLQAQLQELEDAISDQLNKIRTVKANIIKNDGVIETLLRMVINAK